MKVDVLIFVLCILPEGLRVFLVTGLEFQKSGHKPK